jgi:FixJ family two-component response regulator
MGIRTPILLITAYPTAEVEAKALAMGARAFLTKPVSARILEMHVQNAIAEGSA